MIVICILFVIIISYLLGGVNSAIIVTKIKTGKDIRTMGSGNAGLTNTLRTQGKTAALMVLLGDVLKGLLAVVISRFFCQQVGGIDDTYIGYLSGVFAILGACFPVYFGFKGGKGVLVTVSVLYGINPVSASILLGIFLLITLISRYVSLGSVIAAALYPFSTLIFCLIDKDKYFLVNFLLCVFIAFLIIFMHRENLKRLKNGTEKKLGQKS